MMCYKVPKLRVIEGEYAVFELGIERLKIHTSSAIFVLKLRKKVPFGTVFILYGP